MTKYLLIPIMLLCLTGCYGFGANSKIKDNPVASDQQQNKGKTFGKTLARIIPGVGVTDDGTIITVMTKLVPTADYADRKGMTLAEIDKMMTELFPNATTNFNEESYAIPTKKFLLNSLAQAYSKLLMGYQLEKWEDKWDCDDFANEFRMHSIKSNEKSTNKTPGIAVCTIVYKIDNSGWHMINGAIIDKREFIFIEPQTRKEVTLSDTEKKTIRDINF
jgi:hypothetical protein